MTTEGALFTALLEGKTLVNSKGTTFKRSGSTVYSFDPAIGFSMILLHLDDLTITDKETLHEQSNINSSRCIW